MATSREVSARFQRSLRLPQSEDTPPVVEQCQDEIPLADLLVPLKAIIGTLRSKTYRTRGQRHRRASGPKPIRRRGSRRCSSKVRAGPSDDDGPPPRYFVIQQPPRLGAVVRRCNKCGEEKPGEGFFPSNKYQCRACFRAYSARNRERSREQALKRNIFANAVPHGECLIWQGAKNRNGYGHFTVLGNLYRTHRITYEQKFGPVPTGYELHHTCGEKSCCNPTHLQPVSRAEHMGLDGRAEQLRAQARDAAMARWHGQTGGRTR